jgi:purine-binding chemotaxis protein CheW
VVVFRLGEQRYGLRLGTVERIVRAVEVAPLPKGPDIVTGVVNVEGRVVPVLNVRERFGLPHKEITSSDQFLIARTARRPVILVVDEALGIVECSPSDVVEAGEIVPGLEQVQGVIKLENGLVLIHDLEKFLSLDEEKVLEDALSQEAAS